MRVERRCEITSNVQRRTSNFQRKDRARPIASPGPLGSGFPVVPLDLYGWGRLGPDVDPSALELDAAVLQREQGVIAAEADVEAGDELRAALADDDGAGRDDLAAVGLDAAVLR